MTRKNPCNLRHPWQSVIQTIARVGHIESVAGAILGLNHGFNGFMDDTEKSVQSASSVVICDSDDRQGGPHRVSRGAILGLNHGFNGFMDDTEKSVQSASSVVICDSDHGRGAK